MEDYIVRIHKNQRGNEEVDPVTIKAESAASAAKQATETDVVELSWEDQHNAIAVVTLGGRDHQSAPRYFGELNKKT